LLVWVTSLQSGRQFWEGGGIGALHREAEEVAYQISMLEYLVSHLFNISFIIYPHNFSGSSFSVYTANDDYVYMGYFVQAGGVG
jgi:hypothetical protein